MGNQPSSANAAFRQSEPALTRVLLVEDDIDIRETVAELLVEEGYEVQTATSGRDALDHLATCATPPDLVLLDLMMPVMDGWTFHGELQREERWARLPIIVISADANVMEKAARLNPVACLRKPVGIDELLGVVARFRRA
jgi:CheY-like chemotaxis protein